MAYMMISVIRRFDLEVQNLSMIVCPYCRNQISDKAKKCVHCGAVFIPEDKMLCAECGAELQEGSAICSVCGCPVEAGAGTKGFGLVRQAVAMRANVGRKSKTTIAIAVVLVLMISAVVATIGIVQYQKKKAAVEIARRLQEYSENLDLAASAMLSGADDAGNCCSLIDQVWYNAIYERADSVTDKYTQSGGEFVSDFNEALDNLFADPDFYIRINSTMENQNMVSSIMQKLENPPEEYRDAYGATVRLYDAYLILTNMAVNPTGSLKTFSADLDIADAEFVHCCQAVKIDTGQYQENRAVEKAARRSREYSENLRYAIDTMLSGAADSEDCCNLIVQVWNNAIWQKKDSVTDKYTKPDGYFVTDFNEALDNLFADSDFNTQIGSIKGNQKTVNSIIGQLKNPPEEYKAAYEALSECYDAYRTFTNMAINPTGSLNTFSADFDAADTEFIHCYHVMEFYLQE